MGDHLDRMANSQLVHTVELDAFYMDIHEVTVGKFKQFVEDSGYTYNKNLWNEVAKYSPTDEHPMVYVNSNDATAYAQWAGKWLPTETEWKYTARGELISKRYPWGNERTRKGRTLAPQGGRTFNTRVLRGGSWSSSSSVYLRVALRVNNDGAQDIRHDGDGFRCRILGPQVHLPLSVRSMVLTLPVEGPLPLFVFGVVVFKSLV